MKKNLFYVAALFMSLAFATAACSDDDDPVNNPDVPAADIDYTAENATNWHTYMVAVAKLLKDDATTLYNSWATSYEGGAAYADYFKAHNSNDYSSAWSCIEQIIDGCKEIANEVGSAKIGDPYNTYMSGDHTLALYQVESWYSWHSRDDYTNNIWSIRNAYYGSRNGQVSNLSLSALIKNVNADLDTEVKEAIQAAANAIQNIPQPFRNNINSSEAVAAMTACLDLEDVLDKKLKPYIRDNSTINSDAVLDPIVVNYVDVVVLPTYKDLMDENTVLYNAVVALSSSPSNNNFSAACEAWMEAREPWETSEAFLFGPVDGLGLDPNMDSWPLDQDAIVQMLKSGKFDLEWKEGDSEDEITATQEVRGFHTLEFLLFKDGNPRKVN